MSECFQWRSLVYTAATEKIRYGHFSLVERSLLNELGVWIFASKPYSYLGLTLFNNFPVFQPVPGGNNI